MKQYNSIPYSIPYWSDKMLGEYIYAFDKIDGSHIRFLWDRQTKKFVKFATQNRIINKDNKDYEALIDLFLCKYNESLSKLFIDNKNYTNIQSFICYAEYYGPQSFAGRHMDDKKDIILFDVDQYDKGFVKPYDFINDFGSFGIPKLVYKGILNNNFIYSVQQSKELLEGVVCKWTKNESVYQCKIKTKRWLERLREQFKDDYDLEIQQHL